MKSIRTISLVLGTALLLANPAIAAPADESIPLPSFQAQEAADANWQVWAKHYSYESALVLYRAGIWNPIKDHTPDDKIGEGEFFSLLVKVTGNQVDPASKPDPASEKPLTRGETAQWVKALTSFNTGIYNSTPPFPDYVATGQFAEPIRYVYHTGIMMGDGTHFSANEPLTRGQAAVVLRRVLSRMPGMAKAFTFEKLPDTYPAAVTTMIQENKMQAGLYSVTEGDIRYIMVGAGEKPTGGYSVTIDRMYEANNAIYVIAKLQSPEPGQIVAQMVTYPLQVVKINDTKKPIFLLP